MTHGSGHRVRLFTAGPVREQPHFVLARLSAPREAHPARGHPLMSRPCHHPHVST